MKDLYIGLLTIVITMANDPNARASLIILCRPESVSSGVDELLVSSKNKNEK